MIGVREIAKRLTLNVGGMQDVAKRSGLFVYRPVLNADEWEAWATKFGIPDPVAAADMHVTLIYSDVDVKVKPESRVVVLETSRGAFCMFGAEEDVLVVTVGQYDCWTLHDRFYFLTSNGAVTKWPIYRPHMTISYAAPGFEISDEALQAAPEYIVLGGEKFGDLKAEDVAKSLVNPEGWAAADLEMVDVDADLRQAAEDVLKARPPELTALDIGALYQVAKSDKAPRGAIRHINGEADADDEVSKGLELNFEPITDEVAKKYGLAEALKSDDEEQMVTMIASVAKVGKELAKDVEGDEMTSQTLTEFSRDIIRGTRAGQFNHNGDNRFEIVQSLFLSEEIQKALGIDLGFEPYLVEMHIPDPNDWAKIKDGEWGASIRGTLYVEE